MHNHLSQRLPGLRDHVAALPLARLPTPLTCHEPRPGGPSVLVKHDEASGPLYGGNKVRKLEYLLGHARMRGAARVATYGAAGSNHALATALYARQNGFECTCLLSHQPASPDIGRKLLAHQLIGTEIVRFGGDRARRVAIQRATLPGRQIALFPMGGSSWLGTLGFVNAGLELALQCAGSGVPLPDAIYVATGTMGTAVGLALGLALAGADVEVQAVRVTDTRFANAAGLARLAEKTALLLHRFDASSPADLAGRARVVLRDAFYGEGYGKSDAATEAAIAFARSAFGITLDSTYAGKAMAALCKDLDADACRRPLFWNTYNAVPLPVPDNAVPDLARLPEDFSRYFGVVPGDSG